MIDWNKLEEMRPECYGLNDDESRFIIYRLPSANDWRFNQLRPEDRKAICEYSQLADNRVIEIYNLDAGHIETKYYADYYPLVFIDECSFYPEEVIKERMEKYVEFMTVPENAQSFYDMLSETLLDFGSLGYVFIDRSSNNILVNEDFTDLRVIDVVSIGRRNTFMFINPEAVLINEKFTTGYHRGDKTLQTHLGKHFDDLVKSVELVEPQGL